MNYKDKRNKDALADEVSRLLDAYHDYLMRGLDDAPPGTYKKTALLYYWMKSYLSYQKDTSRGFPVYKRGMIIKVDFGFRIGSELGGLHYAIVLSKYDSLKNRCLTVAPLTSNITRANFPGNVNLGDAISSAYIDRISEAVENLSLCSKNLDREMRDCIEAEDFEHLLEIMINRKFNRIAIFEIKEKLRAVNKLKHLSVAMCSQITTIDKLRIYDPKHTDDLFYGAKISDRSLDLIDKTLQSFIMKSIDK